MSPVAVVAALLVIAFGLLGAAKLAALPAMRARADQVGFSVGAYRGIGVLELLGATSVLAGAAVPAIGALGGSGLLFLLAGAVVTHLRNGDGPREIAPAVVLGSVAVAYVGLIVGARP